MSTVAAGTLALPTPQDAAFQSLDETEDAKIEHGGVRAGSDHKEEDDDGKLRSEEEQDSGPKFSLKEQIEKDKDEGRLKRWKEQLFGRADVSAVEFGVGNNAPEVKILTLLIQSPGRPDVNLPFSMAASNNPKRSLFTLKEGSRYRTKFSFNVFNSAVSGLKYAYTVWKTGIRVENTKIMIGTFSPRQEPYTYELEEQIIPCGLFARGSYFVRTKFVDDEGKCYMDFSYYFEIRKNWQ
ncbi:rho GDP-dissociation inhibitor 1-like [Syzygium oleosum]|uniref:rho GDP-dissociation inhibitor 1-like n=1 Tax=Syzygium oleosum TaxID=219896 RepID=UPI0011D282DA|nr:rho GDP-dissociation inhibitor 1-like [Syzygium oleosum]